MVENNKKTAVSTSERQFYLSLNEITYSFGVSSQTIVEIIEEGIVSARKDEQNNWQFDSEDIRRIRTVLRLHEDLGVNMAGAALALELLKEIDRLRSKLT